MNKYIYAECSQEFWPEIKIISANSYKAAVEKLTEKYANEFDDDIESNSFEELQEYLNDKYSLAISNLRDIEEI